MASTLTWEALTAKLGISADAIPFDPSYVPPAAWRRRDVAAIEEEVEDDSGEDGFSSVRPTDEEFTEQCRIRTDCDDPVFGPPRPSHPSSFPDPSCTPPLPPLLTYRAAVAAASCVSGEYIVPLSVLPPHWRVSAWARSLAIEKKASKRIPGAIPEFSVQYKVVDDAWLLVPRYAGFRLFGPPRHDTRVLGEAIPEERRGCTWEMHGADYVVDQRAIVRAAVEQMLGDEGTGVPYGGAILVEPCSSGKTTQAQKIISCLGRVALIVTHTSLLVDQHIGSLRKGMPRARVCKFDASNQDGCAEADVIVATVQSILRLGDEVATRISPVVRRRVGLVVVDEAHRFAADHFRRVTSIFRAVFRLAMTATPNRADGLGVILPMYFGRVAWALAPIPVPHARVVWLRYRGGAKDMEMKNGTLDYTAMVQRLAQDDRRCSLVRHHLRGMRGVAAARGEGVVTMVRMEEMLLRVFEDFRKDATEEGRGGGVEIIYGKHSASKGRRWRETLERARGADALFTTFKFFQEGSDFGHLSAMMCADYTTNMEQTFGRITRGLGRLKKRELDRLRCTRTPLPGMSRPVAVFVVDPNPIFSRSVKVCKAFFEMVEAQQLEFDLEDKSVDWKSIMSKD